jgi:putative MATE family efflux protein
MIGTFVHFIVSITDSAFLNRVSSLDFNASGNAAMIYISVLMFAQGLGNGLQVIVARREGEGRKNEAGKVFNVAILLQLVLSIGLLLILWVIYYLLPATVKDASTGEKMQDFLSVRIWGVFFAAAIQVYNGFYSGIARTRIIMYSTLIMALSNVLLDYCLIFGKLGFPELQIKGAALATVLSEVIALLFVAGYAYADKKLTAYRLFKNMYLDAVLSVSLIKISWPLMIQGFISVGVWTVFFFFLEQMGSEALEISQVVRNFYLIALIPVLGMGVATRTFVSRLIAEQKINEVIPTVFKIMILSFLFIFLFVHQNIFYPYVAVPVISTHEHILADCVHTLRIVTGAMLLMSLSLPLLNLVSGSGDTRTSFRIELISIAVYLTGAWLFTMIYPQPISTVWCMEYVYFGVMALACMYYIKKGKWKNIKV